MFLYGQLQAGTFGGEDTAGPVEERLGELLALAGGDAKQKAGWFEFRLEESALSTKELAEMVLAPEGWQVDHRTIPKGYMMHIVSVGYGVDATICGRENLHIVNALHRDVSKCRRLCDTCLTGVIGRKRVILFAPDQFPADSRRPRRPDMTSSELHPLSYMPEEEAWTKLEQLASRDDVMGGVFNLEPGQFIFVPHGWWHAVKPLDAFTLITGPSQLSTLGVQE